MARRSKRSSTTKLDKPPRKTRKTKASAPGADAPGLGHNRPDERSADQERALFLQHRGPWVAAQANLTLAKKLADVVAAIKQDKFTKKQFEIADALDTISGEARITSEVADRLKVARWMGHPMGAQLDLFNEPDRTPIVDRAYDEGKAASMNNKAAKPGNYAPGTDGYNAYMEGFHDHQRELAAGIKAPGGNGSHAEPV